MKQSSRYFSTFELILLALFSSLVVVSKIVLHLPVMRSRRCLTPMVSPSFFYWMRY